MKISKEVKIGATVVAAIAFLIWGVSFLKGINIFGENRLYYAYYEQVPGLVKASPVTMNGLKIGQVKQLELDGNRVKVQFIIDYPGLEIPVDSKMKFYSVDLLGTKGLKLEQGTSETMADPNHIFASSTEMSLSENVSVTIAPLKKKAEALIGAIDSMVTIVSGVLGKNSGELDESFRSVRRAILKFENTAINIDELISTERARLSSIFAKIDQVSGTLAANSGNLNKTMQNITTITDSLSKVQLTLTVRKAQASIAEINNMLAAINRGEGSLGKLVSTDSLHDALIQTNEQLQRLVDNIKTNPHRYLHFSVFGRRDKGVKLDSKDEKKLKKLLDAQPN